MNKKSLAENIRDNLTSKELDMIGGMEYEVADLQRVPNITAFQLFKADYPDEPISLFREKQKQYDEKSALHSRKTRERISVLVAEINAIVVLGDISARVKQKKTGPYRVYKRETAA